jgi:hypothetical protein
MIQKILDAMENGKKRLQFFNSVMDMFRELILDSDKRKWLRLCPLKDMSFFLPFTVITSVCSKYHTPSFKNILSG